MVMTDVSSGTNGMELLDALDRLDEAIMTLRQRRADRIGWADDNDWDESNVKVVF